jgi:TPR repeat protein
MAEASGDLGRVGRTFVATLFLAVGLVLSVATGRLVGAETRPASTNQPPGPLVGSLGRKEALAFEGNKTFSKSEILAGLTWHIDFLVAAHPLAPLGEYTELVQNMVRAGYRREGFPEAAVAVAVSPNGQRITVKITEGPRFVCGDIKVTGLKTLTNAAIIKRLREAVCGPEQVPGEATNVITATWIEGKPATFDDSARRTLTSRVVGALAEMNYYRPQVDVKVVSDGARKTADLLIEILDEGIKGVIAQIDVAGTENNTREQVLSYLSLRPGMELHALLVNNISNALWNSARFLSQDVALTPLEQPGKFKLRIELEDLEEAPPLNQEFSPEEKALLKLREWLRPWENRREDLGFSMGVTSQWVSVHGDVALSPSGLALVARGASRTDPNRLLYGMVASSRMIGFYSGWRGRKLTYERTRGTVSGFMSYLPLPHSEGGNRFNFSLGAGFSNNEDALEPFHFRLDLAPVAMVYTAHEESWVSSFDQGVLTLRPQGRADSFPVVMKIDVATGRLQSVGFEDRRGYLRFRAEEGAVTRTVKELGRATASHPNDYVAERPLSSFLAFFVSDVLQNPLLAALPTNSSFTLSKELALVQKAWTQATNASETLDFARVFAPIEGIWQGSDTRTARPFDVPLDDVLRGAGPTDGVFALVGAFAVQQSESLWRPDSWPCQLTREAGFMVAGRGKYSVSGLNQLARSGDIGPLGCVVAVRLLEKLHPPLAGPFAARGVSVLTLADFQKDCRLLLSGDSVSSQVISNAASMLGGFTDDTAKLIAEWMKPDDGAFLRQIVHLIRAAPGQPLDEALHPAFERHWDKVIRPRLLAILDTSLPVTHEPTTPEGQAQRGLVLVRGEAGKPDYAEAAKWFRKAAEQGHPGAQFYLAKLYEAGEGVPQGFRDALQWYEKAAAQNHPHAACSIGEMYREGRGVTVDLAEAARWFRKEVEGGCANAQFNLGLVTMPQADPQPWQNWEEAAKWFRMAADQSDPRAQYFLGVYHEKTDVPEALEWYRLAAAGGVRGAQAALGERLSDGFTTAPDYVEAYHWFSLAAAQGDRISQLALKRVERKLTPEQLTKAKKRAARVAAQQRRKLET